MTDDRPKVLIVEDDLTCDLFSQILEDDYAVVTTSNGTQGLALAESERPDLILAELELSGTGGAEMISQIRRTDGIRDIPVIVITAAGMPEDEASARDAGCNAFVLKPIDEDKLLELIREHLG